MIEEKEVKEIVEKILKQKNLYELADLYKKDHDVFRGTHPELISNQITGFGEYGDQSIQTRSKARAYLSDDQLNIASGTLTTVQINTLSSDPDEMFDLDDYRAIIKVTGWYFVIGRITYINTVADKNYQARIYQNAVNVSTVYHPINTTRTLSPTVKDILPFEKDDRIYLKAYHNAGVDTVDIRGNEYETFLGLHLFSI